MMDLVKKRFSHFLGMGCMVLYLITPRAVSNKRGFYGDSIKSHSLTMR